MNELEMILDIPVQITVELGRTKLTIKNLLQLAHGSVVELDAMAENRWTCWSTAPDRPGRSRRGEREVRHPADRHHYAVGAHAQTRPLKRFLRGAPCIKDRAP